LLAVHGASSGLCVIVCVIVSSACVCVRVSLIHGVLPQGAEQTEAATKGCRPRTLCVSLIDPVDSQLTHGTRQESCRSSPPQGRNAASSSTHWSGNVWCQTNRYSGSSRLAGLGASQQQHQQEQQDRKQQQHRKQEQRQQRHNDNDNNNSGSKSNNNSNKQYAMQP